MFVINQSFTLKEIEADFSNLALNAEKSLASKLFESGKIAVDKARQKTKEENGFGNITWNLRASIGCLLVVNHSILPEHIYFPPIGKGSDGNKTGINYAKEIALLVDDGGIILVFVAGMEYAAYVEATDKDVISGSCSEIERNFKALLNK